MKHMIDHNDMLDQIMNSASQSSSNKTHDASPWEVGLRESFHKLQNMHIEERQSPCCFYDSYNYSSISMVVTYVQSYHHMIIYSQTLDLLLLSLEFRKKHYFVFMSFCSVNVFLKVI